MLHACSARGVRQQVSFSSNLSQILKYRTLQQIFSTVIWRQTLGSCTSRASCWSWYQCEMAQAKAEKDKEPNIYAEIDWTSPRYHRPSIAWGIEPNINTHLNATACGLANKNQQFKGYRPLHFIQKGAVCFPLLVSRLSQSYHQIDSLAKQHQIDSLAKQHGVVLCHRLVYLVVD